MAAPAVQWKGSGKLPHKSYTVAERLGEGSCGAVRTVYDEEGTVSIARPILCAVPYE